MSAVARDRFDVIVAGAGIAGMAAAHALADAGLRVLVLEKSSAPAGKCFSYVDPELGHTVEHGVHGVFPRYVNLQQLWRDAGIDDAIFTRTRTTGMAGPLRTMRSTELARARGPAPLFLLGMPAKGVFRLRDFVFAFPFLVRTYAARFEDGAALDQTTFGALLRGAGVSARMAQLLLIPYVRNLAYARGDEVSAHVASLALNYYVVEDSEAVKARWIDGGPSERIFEPWQRALEARGVVFAFDRPVDSIAMDARRF
ncbi:MAG: NAD(P)-binding protein, partial [Polyangiaceae bacterium]|nr:NAD(P)-binding protein [Polyangiaceae bacterium]